MYGDVKIISVCFHLDAKNFFVGLCAETGLSHFMHGRAQGKGGDSPPHHQIRRMSEISTPHPQKHWAEGWALMVHFVFFWKSILEAKIWLIYLTIGFECLGAKLISAKHLQPSVRFIVAHSCRSREFWKRFLPRHGICVCKRWIIFVSPDLVV